MFSKKWQRRSALILLIAYSADLVWKLANWQEFAGGLAWWGIALALTVRFAFMGGVLFIYLKMRRSSDEPQTVTPAGKLASIRSMRIIYWIFFAVIVMYVFLAEWLFRSETVISVTFVLSFYLAAGTTVAVVYAIRQKMLGSASAAMLRNPNDGEAIGKWRAANILGMVVSVSVSLFGLAIRAIGGSRSVAWPLFLAAIALIVVFRPRDASIGSSELGESSQ